MIKIEILEHHGETIRSQQVIKVNRQIGQIVLLNLLQIALNDQAGKKNLLKA